MKAVILCGGKGTRLQEETEFKPKPLVRVGGMPILWHIMKIFGSYGIRDFVLCLGYKGEMIKQYFLEFEELANDFTLDLRSTPRLIHHEGHRLEDWRITFADTGEESMTGCRIARARPYLEGEDNFFLTYGDGVANVDLRALYRHHANMERILTLTGVRQSSPFGIVDVHDGVAKSFNEKPLLDGWVSGGFFVCHREIFKYLDDTPQCTFEEEPLRRLAAHGQVAVYQHTGFWKCMDTYKQVGELNNLWTTSAPWRTWDA